MRALVLAGGFPQIKLIEQLKARGIYVILADWTEHPVAEKYADVFYRESTLDIESIENIAKKEKVDLIMTVCTDQALNTVAEVSERLGLPCYIDAKTGRNVTNKRYMKSVFQQYKIPSAKYCVCRLGESYPEEMNFPVVVKPVDCNSSKGVVKVNNLVEMKTAIEYAQRCSRTKDAIIEEFVDGVELTIDAIVENGVSTVLCISEMQKMKSNQKFVICRSMIPPTNINDALVRKVEEVVQKIATAFKLLNCPMLVQVLCRDNEIFVVEFSARTGGGEKYKSIEQYSGIDIVKETIDITLGKHKPIKPRKSNKYILNEFLYCTQGILGKYEGFETAKQAGYIEDYELFKGKGTKMGLAVSSGDRAAAVTIVSDSYMELKQSYERAMDTIKIIDENGKNIMHMDNYLKFEKQKVYEEGVAVCR